MKANELRIGNLVYAEVNGEYSFTKVYSLSEDELNGFKSYLRTSRPIPLTPEILEKAGFEKVDNFYFHPLIGDYSMEAYDDEFIFACDDCFYNVKLNHVKHLHQLQNLYFALTGEELDVNLQTS